MTFNRSDRVVLSLLVLIVALEVVLLVAVLP